MVFFRGLTLRGEDNNKDQYFIIWRTVQLSGLRESEANLISGSDGIKMFYKTKDFSWTYCSRVTCICIWLKLQRIKITPTLVSMRKFECLGNNKYWILLLLSCYVANSLQPHGLQHTRLPCPHYLPGVAQIRDLEYSWPSESTDPASSGLSVSWIHPLTLNTQGWLWSRLKQTCYLQMVKNQPIKKRGKKNCRVTENISCKRLSMCKDIIMLLCVFGVVFRNVLIYPWLWWVFVATHGVSLVAESEGHSLLWHAGFLLRRLLMLRSTGSRHAGFSSCCLECFEGNVYRQNSVVNKQ